VDGAPACSPRLVLWLGLSAQSDVLGDRPSLVAQRSHCTFLRPADSAQGTTERRPSRIISRTMAKLQGNFTNSGGNFHDLSQGATVSPLLSTPTFSLTLPTYIDRKREMKRQQQNVACPNYSTPPMATEWILPWRIAEAPPSRIANALKTRSWRFAASCRFVQTGGLVSHCRGAGES
jgi:hypothetical protein